MIDIQLPENLSGISPFDDTLFKTAGVWSKDVLKTIEQVIGEKVTDPEAAKGVYEALKMEIHRGVGQQLALAKEHDADLQLAIGVGTLKVRNDNAQAVDAQKRLAMKRDILRGEWVRNGGTPAEFEAQWPQMRTNIIRERVEQSVAQHMARTW